MVRFVVTAEMLAAGAPCFAHWIADRQSGPQILAHGSERAKHSILPRICRGECFFGIGMSEPESGSDLAAVRTRAERRDGGWAINGSKIWTSNAHHAHYLIALVRTGEAGEDRHGGLTQFIVDMSSPGIRVRPIHNLAGGHEFNEVFFEDVFVPDDMMVGAEGEGWAMVTRELAFERSGPDHGGTNSAMRPSGRNASDALSAKQAATPYGGGFQEPERERRRFDDRTIHLRESEIFDRRWRRSHRARQAGADERLHL
ncbi:MAG TPA: acyl-CoA dehydrogenase family protein [Alphaproteobacteria bacterium]|nr:acyl-CoA dehydrogenase family protein [Alphaproteobacteria bacterium]